MVMHSIKMHDSSTGLRMQIHSQTLRIYLTEVSPRVKGQRLNFLRFAASKSTKRIYSWLKLYLLFSCMRLLTDAHHLLGQSCWCHCVFVWAHGLLFVVGAMCSPVYCLTPHFLLSHYCFSVFLVCLPMYSPGVCSPMRFRCLTSCECYVCLCCRSPSRGGFCFFWLLNDPLFICTWVLASSLLTRHDRYDRLDVCVLMT